MVTRQVFTRNWLYYVEWHTCILFSGVSVSGSSTDADSYIEPVRQPPQTTLWLKTWKTLSRGIRLTLPVLDSYMPWINKCGLFWVHKFMAMHPKREFEHHISVDCITTSFFDYIYFWRLDSVLLEFVLKSLKSKTDMVNTHEYESTDK